jgi:hypothetical protein
MSCILYYSNFCEHSKKLLQTVSKSQSSKDIHFICIDKRVKERDGKTYIVLENGQKIVMPENVQKVPALLLLNNQYRVLYGDDIYNHMKPMEQVVTQQATFHNMEPSAFSLGGSSSSFGGIVSDNFSFLDMDSDSLNTKGSGGMRQMHNYVALTEDFSISTPKDDHDYKASKTDGLTLEQLQAQRDQDYNNLVQNQRR